MLRAFLKFFVFLLMGTALNCGLLKDKESVDQRRNSELSAENAAQDQENPPAGSGQGNQNSGGGSNPSDNVLTLPPPSGELLDVEPPFLLYVMNDWAECKPLDMSRHPRFGTTAELNSRCPGAQYIGIGCTQKSNPSHCSLVRSDQHLYIDAPNLDAANKLVAECGCDISKTVEKGADNLEEAYPLGAFGSHKAFTGGMFWKDIQPEDGVYNFSAIDKAVTQVQTNKILQGGKEVSSSATITMPIYGAHCEDYTPKWVYRKLCGNGSDWGLKIFKYHRTESPETNFQITCSCNESATGYANDFFDGKGEANTNVDKDLICSQLLSNPASYGLVVEDTCAMPPFSSQGVWWEEFNKALDKIGQYIDSKPEIGIVLTALGTDDEDVCETHNGWVHTCPDNGKFMQFVKDGIDVYAKSFPSKYVLAQLTGGDTLTRPLHHIIENYTAEKFPSPKASLKRARVGLKGNFHSFDRDNQMYYQGNKNHTATYLPDNMEKEFYEGGFMGVFTEVWQKIVTGAEHGITTARKEIAKELADQLLYEFYLQALHNHVIMLDTWDSQMHDKWANNYLNRYLGRSALDTPEAWTVMHDTKYLCKPDASSLTNSLVKSEYAACQNDPDYSVNCCLEVAKKYEFRQWLTASGGKRGDFTFFLERVDGIAGGLTKVIPPRERLVYDEASNDFRGAGNSAEYVKYIPEKLWNHRFSYSARRTDVGSNQKYMYFKLDSEFPHKKNNLTGYKVSVIYLDAGNDEFAIEYLDAQGALKSKKVQKNNTQDWVETTVDCADAVFSGKLVQAQSIDFALNALDGDEVIHRVAVLNE